MEDFVFLYLTSDINAIFWLFVHIICKHCTVHFQVVPVWDRKSISHLPFWTLWGKKCTCWCFKSVLSVRYGYLLLLSMVTASVSDAIWHMQVWVSAYGTRDALLRHIHLPWPVYPMWCHILTLITNDTSAHIFSSQIFALYVYTVIDSNDVTWINTCFTLYCKHALCVIHDLHNIKYGPVKVELLFIVIVFST